MKQKIFMVLLLSLLLCHQMGLESVPARAASNGSVVINEVAWAGSVDSAYDEWIELYNNTSSSVDLTGWNITNTQGTTVYHLSGSIGAHGYYLIERSENAVNPQIANKILSLSLANSGISLILVDQNNAAIDKVNSAGGAWFAGNATSRGTMERIDPLGSGDDAKNWATNKQSSGSKASAGSLILGTPGAVNSVAGSISGSSGASSNTGTGEKVYLEASPDNVNSDTLKFIGKIENATNVFSYGVEIDYDPNVLVLVTSSKGSFLSQNEDKETSFQSGLQDGNPGKLLIAEAITEANSSGTSGSGDLFEIDFKVLQNQNTNISFGTSSFVADNTGDITTLWQGTSVQAMQVVTDPVTNASAAQGEKRYSIDLQWTLTLSGADDYHIYRKSNLGTWMLLGETTGQKFTDMDGIANGGNIIPFVEYAYRITALKSGKESDPLEITGKETRGLKGDNNRSDLVDGRDLENLALHFGETTASNSFKPTIDSNYDGQIDGSDLIDLGLNFAKSYS